MAVPMFISISPANGPTRGDMIVEILGFNFQLPAIPPTSPSNPVPPTVQVLFGGTPSPLVEVMASSMLFVTVPVFNPGVVDVVVQNIDATGAVIGSETVTAAGAFTYAIPGLTSEFESDLAAMVRVLLRALKQQTIAREVTRPVHVDFDDTTGDSMNIVKVGAFPALTVLGPEMRENRFYTNNEPTSLQVDLDGDGDPETFIEARVPYVVDLIFTIVGVSDRDAECLNLMASFMQFVHRNIYLYLLRVRSQPQLGSVKFEFDFAEDGQPHMPGPGTPNNSSIAQWTARVIIRGFMIEDLSGISTGYALGTAMPNHAVVNRGKTALEVNIAPAKKIGDD